MYEESSLSKKKIAVLGLLQKHLSIPKWTKTLMFFIIAIISTFLSGVLWEIIAYDRYSLPIEEWHIAVLRGLPFGLSYALFYLIGPVRIFNIVLSLLDSEYLNWKNYFRKNRDVGILAQILIISLILISTVEVAMALIIHSCSMSTLLAISLTESLFLYLGIILGIAVPVHFYLKFLNELYPN